MPSTLQPRVLVLAGPNGAGRSKDDVREIGEGGDLQGEDVVPGFRVALRELFRAD